MYVASLILIFTVVTIFFSLGVEAHNYTRTHGTFNALTKRTKRLVVFPKDAAILFTVSISKNLLDGRPTGTVMIYELDHMVPLPDSLDAWKPKPKKINSSAPPVRMSMDSRNVG